MRESWMRMTLPQHETHALLCDYGHLFSFVPGDSGNPFVALWQAGFLEAAILAVAGGVLVMVGRARRGGAQKYVGYGYLAMAAVSATLAGVTLGASTPLTCGGAPGIPSTSGGADPQAFQAFLTLSTLSTLMRYLTLILVLGFMVMSVLWILKRLTRAALSTISA